MVAHVSAGKLESGWIALFEAGVSRATPFLIADLQVTWDGLAPSILHCL